MKRKLIQTLLQSGADESAKRILAYMPGVDPAIDAARTVLAESLLRCRMDGIADPADVYAAICNSAPADLKTFLKGSKAARFNKQTLTASQAILIDVLTSKAGRKKTSELSRKEQFAAAAARQRDKAKEQDRKRLDCWISPEAHAQLDTIQREHSCGNQAEAVELVLNAVTQGKPLKRKS